MLSKVSLSCQIAGFFDPQYLWSYWIAAYDLLHAGRQPEKKGMRVNSITIFEEKLHRSCLVVS